MTNEPEWRDANPSTEDLPNKGRSAIICITGGLVLGVLTVVGLKIRIVGLAVGSLAFFTGIGFIFRKRSINYKTAIIITVAGFLMLLSYLRFGVVKAFAGYFLITGSIALVVLGICKAIKLSWELGKRS